MYKHFVITLFNLRNFLDGTTDKKKWISWTKDRIEIFKKYCLPSVISQSQTNFNWLIYLDAETPIEIKKEIQLLLLIDQRIEIIYKKGYSEFFDTYISDIRHRTPSEIEWIMQTRLDNDDIIHKEAICYIQKNFKSMNGYLISLASGYTLQKSNLFLSHYYYPMGPFLTLIESNDESMKGIYYCNHWQWPHLRLWILNEILAMLQLKKERAHFVLKKKLWIQLIHSNNMHNTADRGFPIFSSRLLNDFLPGLYSIKSPLNRVLSHAHYVWWKRYFKATIVKFFRQLFCKPD